MARTVSPLITCADFFPGVLQMRAMMVQHLVTWENYARLGAISFKVGCSGRCNWRLLFSEDWRTSGYRRYRHHWIDTVSHASARADTVFYPSRTFHKLHLRPKGEVQTFAKIDRKRWYLQSGHRRFWQRPWGFARERWLRRSRSCERFYF